jgi:hypothetical protein
LVSNKLLAGLGHPTRIYRVFRADSH